MHHGTYGALHLFSIAARHASFSDAGAALNLTKGAVSYQIRQLEQALGFAVFERNTGGVTLTDQGRDLLSVAQSAFGDLDAVIDRLRTGSRRHVTVALSTYFASRWLSPRLMTFLVQHPDIRLSLQPLLDPSAPLAGDIDLSIRWGNGQWRDAALERLFACPAFPTAGGQLAREIGSAGLEVYETPLPLLHDRDGSPAWRDWHKAAGRSLAASRDALVIPDPNVRVQAVIDGQGIALNDRLADPELADGRLSRVSEIELEDYGYFLAYRPGAMNNEDLAGFRDWIVQEARDDRS